MMKAISLLSRNLTSSENDVGRNSFRILLVRRSFEYAFNRLCYNPPSADTSTILSRLFFPDQQLIQLRKEILPNIYPKIDNKEEERGREWQEEKEARRKKRERTPLEEYGWGGEDEVQEVEPTRRGGSRFDRKPGARRSEQERQTQTQASYAQYAPQYQATYGESERYVQRELGIGGLGRFAGGMGLMMPQYGAYTSYVSPVPAPVPAPYKTAAAPTSTYFQPTPSSADTRGRGGPIRRSRDDYSNANYNTNQYNNNNYSDSNYNNNDTQNDAEPKNSKWEREFYSRGGRYR